MSGVLVTSGENRSSLAAVRSLGRAGHEVAVCSLSGRSLAGASRWAVTDRAVACPLENPCGFAWDVANMAEDLDSDVVLPVTDAAVLSILQHGGRMPETVTVPCRSLDTYRALADKERVIREASGLDIAVPAQRILATRDAVDELELSELTYPLVIKPTRSVVSGDEPQLEQTRVLHAATASRMREVLDTLPSTHYPVLLQEYISGSGAGVFLLRWNGQTFARFAHRRLREKPPSGGVSVYRESIEPPSGLFESSEQLLERFDWRGVAMVEYRMDARDGVPYLMEVNGRLWGSLQLAVDAGVDFPRLLVALAEGRSPDPVLTYRTGIQCRWWWGEVDHLLARLRGRGVDPEMEGLVDRLRALGPFLLPWRPGDRYEVLRLDDPLPFLRESRLWLCAALTGDDGGTV